MQPKRCGMVGFLCYPIIHSGSAAEIWGESKNLFSHRFSSVDLRESKYIDSRKIKCATRSLNGGERILAKSFARVQMDSRSMPQTSKAWFILYAQYQSEGNLSRLLHERKVIYSKQNFAISISISTCGFFKSLSLDSQAEKSLRTRFCSQTELAQYTQSRGRNNLAQTSFEKLPQIHLQMESERGITFRTYYNWLLTGNMHWCMRGA